MDSNVYTSAGMLRAKRLSPETPASELFSDWMCLTIKPASTVAGISTCTINFYDIRGKQLNFGATLSNTDGIAVADWPLASIFRNSTAWSAWDLITETATIDQLREIALVEFTTVAGTLIVGYGASQSGYYGEIDDSTTWSVTGAASSGTLTITSGDRFGFGAV